LQAVEQLCSILSFHPCHAHVRFDSGVIKPHSAAHADAPLRLHTLKEHEDREAFRPQSELLLQLRLFFRIQPKGIERFRDLLVRLRIVVSRDPELAARKQLRGPP
jgi:hypothetical protein